MAPNRRNRDVQGNRPRLSIVPKEDTALIADVVALDETAVVETAPDLEQVVVEEPVVEQTPDETPDETPGEDTPPADEPPADLPPEETEPEPTPLPTTSDPNRIRAAELLASIESTVMNSPADQWGDLLITIAAEAALLTPLLTAPVSECDACRGKIIRDAPPVVHTPECNTEITHAVARVDSENALRAKIEALPDAIRDEFGPSILETEMPKIAARYECNCGAAAKARAATTRSTGGGTGVRGERRATKRMTTAMSKFDGTNPQVFTITFPEDGTTNSWTMPIVGDTITAADLATVKRITKESADWAVANGASPDGQKNAVSKAIRDNGYKLGELAAKVR